MSVRPIGTEFTAPTGLRWRVIAHWHSAAGLREMLLLVARDGITL